MIRRPPGSTRTDTLFPYPTLFRSAMQDLRLAAQRGGADDPAGRQVRNRRGFVRDEGIARVFPRQDGGDGEAAGQDSFHVRSEEHTSELQSLMRISYAVFCLKKKNKVIKNTDK